MKTNTTRVFITILAAILLAVSLTLAFSACNGGVTETESGTETEASTVKPTDAATSKPTETKPSQTEPQETEPVETNPQETATQETEPQGTEPQGTEPQETEPQETEPQETEPKETEPVETEPVFTTGMSFSSDDRVLTDKALSKFPITAGFKFKLDPAKEAVSSYGILFSNSIKWGPALSYEITKKGNPSLKVESLGEDSKGYRWNKETRYTFDKVNVCTGELVDLYFIIDVAASKMHCYFNGELAQTVSINAKLFNVDCYSKNPFVVGGSMLGSNYNYFRGELYSLSVWSDFRTAEEISYDTKLWIEPTDSNLITRYVFIGEGHKELLMDMSNNGHDLHVERLWLDKSEVEEPTGDYCFAVLGDTQSLVKVHPEKISVLYDWLLENKDAKNIQYVMGLGDITNDCTEEQFAVAKENIYKLNGKIPFSLVPGNHDKDDFKSQGYYSANPLDYYYNKVFYEEPYLSQLDGWYGEGDVTSSYNAFTVGSTKWLVVNLDFGAPDAVLDWAGKIIEAHADHRVIVVTHAYLYRDGTTIDSEDCYAASRYHAEWNDGDEIFDQLVSKYENIELVISGHDPHDHIICSQVKGDKGNTVTQLLIDPQYMDNYYGPTGMVALLYFSESDNTLTIRYYSTVKDMYGSELSQFSVKLD